MTYARNNVSKGWKNDDMRDRIDIFLHEYYYSWTEYSGCNAYNANRRPDMALKLEVIKKRLKETFGSDSQEIVGKKLNMTQGNVSKLLSGGQQPTLETIYHVAEAYGVSVDWILGITNNKVIEKSNDIVTYRGATKAISDLVIYRAIEMTEDVHEMVLTIKDPLIKNLVRKSITLRKTDKELNTNWEENKLSLFSDCPLVSPEAWKDDRLFVLLSEAVTESNWKEVYDKADKIDAEYAEMYGDNINPFGEE